jgi:plasmid stabilization system protein ParE
MQMRYTATALRELDEIFQYIAERSPAAAKAIVERVEQTVALLADFPEMAQRTNERGVLRMPVGSYPFLVFYTIENDEIVILHVRHGARRYPWE